MPAGYLIPVSAADPWKIPSRWILRVVGPCHLSAGPPACEAGALMGDLIRRTEPLTIKQTALGLAPGGHKGGGADAKGFKGFNV